LKKIPYNELKQLFEASYMMVHWLDVSDTRVKLSVQTLSTLGQTKAYYYWRRDWLEEG